MNGSPYEIRLVLSILTLAILAIVVAAWTVEQYRVARRTQRASDLRRQRALHRDGDLYQPHRGRRGAFAGVSAVRVDECRDALDAAQRARLSGVDELQIDDLANWSQRVH